MCVWNVTQHVEHVRQVPHALAAATMRSSRREVSAYADRLILTLMSITVVFRVLLDSSATQRIAHVFLIVHRTSSYQKD